MRVVFVNRFFYPDQSATSQLLTELCFDLARRGLAVSVISSRQIIDDPHAGLPARECCQGVQVYRVWSPRFGRGSLPGRSFDYLGFYLCAAWRAFTLLGRGDVLVAKTDPPMLSVALAGVVSLRGAALVNWLQDLFPEVATALGVRGIAGPTARLLRWLRNASLKQARMNVVLGRQMAAHLRAEGIPARRLRVIHNWADGRELAPLAAADNQLRRQWDLEHAFVVEYSGNMGRAHEFETILDAARQLRADAAIRFVFIGGGALRSALELGARERGLDNLLFKPYQDRHCLRQSLGLADVHLVSLQPQLEGLIVPSKFYGIAAVGRACIHVGDPRGEIAQIISASGCGCCIRPGDSAALAGAIRALAAAPDKCREQGRRAREVFEDRFQRQRALGDWSRVLEAGAGDGASNG